MEKTNAAPFTRSSNKPKSPSPVKLVLDQTKRLFVELRNSPRETILNPPAEINLYTMLASQATICIVAGLIGLAMAVGTIYRLPPIDPTSGAVNAAAFAWSNHTLQSLAASYLLSGPLCTIALTGIITTVDSYARDCSFTQHEWGERYLQFATGLIPYAVAVPLGSTLNGLIPLVGLLTSAYLIDRSLYSEMDESKVGGRRATLFIFFGLSLLALPGILV